MGMTTRRGLLGRRTFLRGAAVGGLGLAAAALIGCEDGESEDSAATPPAIASPAPLADPEMPRGSPVE